MQNKPIKPNKASYVNFVFAIRFILISVLFAIGFLFGYVANLSAIYHLVLLLAFVAIQALSRYSLLVSYRKTEYIFDDDKIIATGGGIFHDYETELLVKNITQVTLTLPFFRNNLLETGRVKIKAAGTGGVEVTLADMDNPENFYKQVRRMMIDNGFDLSEDDLIQAEKPQTVPVLINTGSALIFVFFLLFGSLHNFISGNLFSAGVSIIVVVSALLSFSFMYLDLKRRIYRVFSELVTYEEYFFNKKYSFIPAENISNSTVTQGFINKLLGYYNAKISCQGTGQEILFKNIANGPLMEENIDRIISQSDSKKIEKSTEKEEEPGLKERKRERPEAETEFTGSYKMDIKRSILPLLVILPALPVWIAATLGKLIQALNTEYKINKKSVEQKFSFLTRKDKGFSNEKITGITFKENPLDWIFGTYKIRFWSVGARDNVEFKHIKKNSELSRAVLSKVGIKNDEKISQFDSSFSFVEMLKANFYLTVLLAVLLVIFSGGLVALDSQLLPILMGLLVLFLFVTAYKKIYYGRSKLKFFEDYLTFEKGVVFQERYFVLYEDVKDIDTLRYPFSEKGTIQFNVAGEKVIQTKNGEQRISNKFKIRYVEKIGDKDDIIDLFFHRRPDRREAEKIIGSIQDYKPETLSTHNPDVGNTLLLTAIPGILIFPIWIPFVILWVKRKSYHLQSYRVVARSGIFYRKQTSIVYNKIDHINSRQGAVNKIFKNGNVIINTMGSSTPELKIVNIPEYKEFYRNLKKKYEKE